MSYTGDEKIKGRKASDSVISSYTEQKYKRNTFVFAPIFHDLNSKI